MSGVSLQMLEKISYKVRSHCAVCAAQLARPAISLPKLPLTEIYTREKPKTPVGFADQKFYYCEVCQHGQLGHILDPKILYSQSAYFFRTSQSRSAKIANDVFLKFIQEAIKGLKLKTIIEFGSSDLYLLHSLKHRANKLIGVDPILKGKEQKLSDNKITAIGDFIENVDLGREMKAGNSLVLSSHTLEHVVDPKHLLEILFAQASDRTWFIFQFPGLETLVRDRRYDEIFHQHLQYFSLSSFTRLLVETGGELITYTINPYHWGSLLVVFKKKTRLSGKKIQHNINSLISVKKIRADYKVFQQQMHALGSYLKELNNEKVYGYGAALMLPILSYHLHNNLTNFTSIIDDDPHKKNLYYINLPVKVRPSADITDPEKATIVITALNAMRLIIPKVLAMNPKRIIIPLSTL